MRLPLVTLSLFALLASTASATPMGWRRDGTGRFPEACGQQCLAGAYRRAK